MIFVFLITKVFFYRLRQESRLTICILLCGHPPVTASTVTGPALTEASTMSYYPPQSYGSYQTPYTQYPQPTPQYPTQFPQGPLPNYPYPPGAVNQGSPPPDPPTPTVPAAPTVTPEIASRALQRLLSVELRDIGFDAAEPAALKRLELDVAACSFSFPVQCPIRSTDALLPFIVVDKLYQRAHEFANLANRATPIAKDLYLASEACAIHTKDLRELADHTNNRRKIGRFIMMSAFKFSYSALSPA